MNITCEIVTTEKELMQAYDLRTEVFVKEQGVPKDLELDELDKTAIHVVAIYKDGVIGCGRIVITPDKAYIGRVAVKKYYRNLGFGKQLMIAMINIAREKGAKDIILHAQMQVVPFYESLGFTKHGETFIDAGIEHIEMRFGA
jgi:predicted GNAT family N-acyltransferase